MVPILEHEKGFINDSWEIIKWLDENYPENKLFINETSKNFSYFLYLWTSRQLLPVLFKIIAHEIPNVLEGEDINYYIRTREDRNKFMDETVGMKKYDSQNYFDNFYK